MCPRWGSGTASPATPDTVRCRPAVDVGLGWGAQGRAGPRNPGDPPSAGWMGLPALKLNTASLHIKGAPRRLRRQPFGLPLTSSLGGRVTAAKRQRGRRPLPLTGREAHPLLITGQ